MKRKDLNYKFAREYLYNKDKYLDNFIDDMLIKVNQMFHYENLPDTIPKRILEKYLTESGYCIFTKHNDKFVILQGGLGGELNEYYEYTKCIVANPYLKLNKEYTINDDCILIRNDSRMKGLISILSRYAVLCGDCEISLNMLTNVLRSQYLISAGDNKTKESADNFIKRLFDGDFSCIAENTFLDGVKVHGVSGDSKYIQQFIELNQYLKATAYNEIGLNANFNMKRERLNQNEVDLNTSILIPLADDMLEERKKAVELINEKYGLNISVDLSSVWKMTKESVDNATQTQETETEEEKETETEEKETETTAETETETEEETTAETETETEEETTEENKQGVENE
ncbi:MAG: hypothetical protein J6U02_00550 [Elusimicrobia bacterium]|nr:hypothetical protein [Elusimicrobiota bacterium]